MRFKLSLLLLLASIVPALAQNTGVSGVVLDASGNPVSGAAVMLNDQGIVVTTGPAGEFRISNAVPGTDVITVAAYGYNDLTQPVQMAINTISDLGQIKLKDSQAQNMILEEQQELLFDQSALEDDEGTSQSVGVLTGASDNIYYNTANYRFSLLRFRNRGYDSYFTTTYINGLPFNDLARGRFNFSTLGGMTSTAFRNRTNTVGLDAARYGFGGIGGSTNFNTITSTYSPGFRGSVAYTNSAYMLRASLLYSTGINAKGWGLTVGAIGRYANEGVIEGTFYNSGGLFLSLEKVINDRHNVTLTAFGAPTQRATASATYLEAYQMAGDNLYNPNWGYQDGKKRASRIVESFDPTVMLNWNFKINEKTHLNTGVATRWTHYSTSALNWYNAADPRPDYYRNLPSYFSDYPGEYDYYAEQWRNNVNFRQLDWDALYQANYLNNLYNQENPTADPKGATYIQEKRHSNQFNFIFSTVLNHKFSDSNSLQAGLTANVTRAHYYKTIKDLLGGEFWLDVDQFAERDFPNQPDLLQNDLNNPNRKVKEGDIFGYNYYVNAVQASAWIQDMIQLDHWNINYGMEMSYTQFFRDGKMRNGRAPENSYGKGDTHRFDNGAIKAGITYKLDGRNAFSIHGEYATKAPLFEYAYVSPRTKDNAIDGLKNMRVLSADFTYAWNYRRFRGAISAFYTDMYDLTEKSGFYDDNYSTYMNYVIYGVRQNYKGIELGLEYSILPSLKLQAAGTIASYRYKNNPMGVRSYENGAEADVYARSYLKNYHIGGTPQKAVNVGLDYAAPKSWFFNVNATWMGDTYVNLAPVRHEIIPDLWAQPDPEQLNYQLCGEEKLHNAFTLNASIGKLIYLKRKYSLNINVNIDNILNNRNIMTYGYQQGRFDYKNFTEKVANRYSYAQGIKVFVNVGLRF